MSEKSDFLDYLIEQDVLYSVKEYKSSKGKKIGEVFGFYRIKGPRILYLNMADEIDTMIISKDLNLTYKYDRVNLEIFMKELVVEDRKYFAFNLDLFANLR